MPPPNLKGGKHYKKKAKGGDEDSEFLKVERLPDQQVARVIRVLGNRNMMCYCNDNKMRICHVRGKLRNRCYVEIGDLVLVSLRDYDSTAINEVPADKKKELDRGDILFKYPYEYLSKLKKEDGVNGKLFMTLETMDGIRLGALGGQKATANTIEDDEGGFEFDREGAAEESSESESDSDLDVDNI